METGRAEILARIKLRIAEGWQTSVAPNQGTMVYPPETDRKRNWCAVWKPVRDVETGITYLYPHWINVDDV